MAGSIQQKAGFRAATSVGGHRSRHLVAGGDFVTESAAEFDCPSIHRMSHAGLLLGALVYIWETGRRCLTALSA